MLDRRSGSYYASIENRTYTSIHPVPDENAKAWKESLQ